MPKRKTPIVTGRTYHIFNRSVAGQRIFNNDFEYKRFLSLIDYYRHSSSNLRFSYFVRLGNKQKEEYLTSLLLSSLRIHIFAFAIMPTHYHLLTSQSAEGGISNFVRIVQNSYARYINTKDVRHGALFQSPFKAVAIETEYEFVHVSRYIHLNPITGNVLNSVKMLYEYPWTSYIDYVNSPRTFVSTDRLKSYFAGEKELSAFTTDRADYQKNLGILKHHTPGV